MKVLGTGCLSLLEDIQTKWSFTASFICFWFYCVSLYIRVCVCVLYYCHRVSTQLQLSNISSYISHNISYHIIYRIVSYHIISYRIVSYSILSYRIISYHISYIISCIVSYHIVSCHIIYHVVSSHILSYRTVSYRIVSYRIIYHLTISFHIIMSYHIYLIISYQKVEQNLD